MRLEDGTTRILMHALPEDPTILPPALRDPTRADFAEVTQLLRRFEIPVPELLAQDPNRRWLLLEDLGDVHVADLEGEPLVQRLDEAATLLARVHSIRAERGVPFSRAFDEQWVSFEMEHFVEHGVAGPLRAKVRPATQRIVARVAALPRSLCLRDYQSQNLMIDPSGRLRLLDYQDALLAPPELDLAAFLYDSYLELQTLRPALLERYETSRQVRVDPQRLALLVVQRKCKDYARFRYLIEVKGDGRFGVARSRARAAILETLPEASSEAEFDLGPIRDALEHSAA